MSVKLGTLRYQIHIGLGDVELSDARRLEGHLYTVYIQSLRNEIPDHHGVEMTDRNLVRVLVVRKLSLDIGSDLRSVNSVPPNRNPTL